MKNLSKFDIAMIIAFAVVGLLGAAGWYWLTGQLTAAQADAATAAGAFDQYSKKEVFLPTKTNIRTLKNNIAVMTQQFDPIVQNRLQSSKNGLKGVHGVDTVDWKHDLDEEVGRLNNAASTRGITVPPNFYYGFSRYLTTNPAEQATDVLERQQLAIGAVAEILINAPVDAIVRVQRTAEEDPAPSTNPLAPPPPTRSGPETDIMPGRSVDSAAGVYTSYPFTFEFDAKTENFRTVINQIMQSDYVFVVRSILVQNSKIVSPKVRDLDTMAGATDQTSMVNSSPGAVAASAPTVGLQYLFGDETLHIRMVVDLIDWHGLAQPGEGVKGPGGTHNPPRPGAHLPGAQINPPPGA
jgi:hypothetical protein